MKSVEKEYVVIGKLGSTHGIQGWLKLYSFTEPATNIMIYKPWYLEEAVGWKLIKLEASKKHAKNIIIKLAGYDTPEQARLLTGKKIAVLRSQLPPLNKDTFYWSDLQGLTVINKNGAVLGKVIYLLETGSNDVLVVKGDKEHAIPYLVDVIVNVDLASQVIYVNWEFV
jgi:16S rRNA processing protein RimM